MSKCVIYITLSSIIFTERYLSEKYDKKNIIYRQFKFNTTEFNSVVIEVLFSIKSRM